MPEESKEFYNKIFKRRYTYNASYKKAHSYLLWQKINIPEHYSILDIGCGTGQFAEYLKSRGIKKYVGIDFSDVAIKRAKKRVPEFEFHNIDIFSKELLQIIKRVNPDIYVCLEILEHIEKDKQLLKSLVSKEIFVSVPNFMCKGHVRCFKNKEEIYKRYEDLIDIDYYYFWKRWHLIHGKII